MAVFLFPYLRGCSIMCSYIPVQFNRQQNIFPCNKMVLNTSMADPLMTIFGHYYCIPDAKRGYYGFIIVRALVRVRRDFLLATYSPHFFPDFFHIWQVT